MTNIKLNLWNDQMGAIRQNIAKMLMSTDPSEVQVQKQLEIFINKSAMSENIGISKL